MNANERSKSEASLSKDIEALRRSGPFVDGRAPWRASAGVLVLLAIAIAVASWFVLDQMRARSERVYSFGVSGGQLAPADAWIRPALERALAAHLAASDDVRLISAEDGLPQFSPDDELQAVRRRSGADWALGVELANGEGETVSATLQLTDLATATVMPGRQVIGTRDAIGDLAGRAAAELLQLMDKPGLDALQVDAADAELPSGADAARAFTEALAALEKGDGETALERLKTVEAETPGHPLAISARSQAWALMGYAARSAADAQLAFDRRAGLSRERELSLEAHMLEANGGWDEASEVWQALVRFYPDDISYGLELADARMRADRFDDALDAIGRLRSLQPPYRDDPRIDLLESRIHNRAGRFAESVAAADRAIARAEEIGATALVAEAQLAAVASDAENAQARLETALAIYNRSDNPRGESTALKELGDLAVQSGRLEDGEASYLAAIELAREAGNPPQVAAAENALAIALDLQGRLQEGYEIKLRVAEYYRERDVLSRHSIMLENLGISLMKLGRFEEAEEKFDEALGLFEEIGDGIGIAWAPYHRGRLAIRRGRLDEGSALIGQAIANAAERPEGNLEIHSRFEQMSARFYAGDYAAAADAARDLSQSYQDMDLPLDAAETELFLARSYIHLGDLERAQQAITWALDQTEVAGAGYYNASAHVARVDLELAGAGVGADEACQSLKDVATDLEHTIIRLRAAVRLATCEAWLGAVRPADMSDRLAEVDAQARDAGLFEPAYDARRAQVYVLAMSGRTREARAMLEELNADALVTGWAQAPMGCLGAPPSSRCEVTASAE